MIGLKNKLILSLTSIVLSSSLAFAGTITAPTFSVTFGENLKKFITQNPYNPTLTMKYNYSEYGGSAAVTSSAALSGIPGEQQYDWQSEANHLGEMVKPNLFMPINIWIALILYQ